MISRTLVALVVGCGCLFLAGGTGRGEDLVHQYFERLRERGLYLLAEEYAISHLGRERLPPAERALLTIEFSQTLTEHGTLVPPAQRHELWSDAARALRELLEREPTNPRRSQLEAQLALLPALQGGALAWSATIAPDDDALRRQALELLTSGEQQLRTWLERSSGQRPSESQLADGAMTAVEAAQLRSRVQFQIGLSLLHRGELLPAGKERTAALLDAGTALDQLLRSRTKDDLTFEGQLARARLARLQGDDARAASLLEGRLQEELSLLQRDRVLAEQIRLEMSRERWDDALKIVRERAGQEPPLSDELRASVVELLLASWRIAGQKNLTELQGELLQEATSHHQKTGGRWRQQTNASLTRIRESEDLGEDLAKIVRDARAAFQRGEIETSLAGYGEAAGMAHRSGQSERAVEYAMTRGSILLQQKRWNDAAAAFAELVQKFPHQERAADAGILECYARGQQYLARPTQPHREEYEAALARHRRTYPTSPTYFEATWMLATHQEQRLQWTDALPLYREIAPEHARHDEALLRIMIVYDKILSRLREHQQPLNRWEDEAAEEVARMEPRLTKAESLTSIQCQVLLRGAQLLLQHRDRLYARADQLLARANDAIRQMRQRAERSGETLPPVWSQLDHGVSQLRIVSLAGQRQLTQAGEVLDRLGQTDPSEMLQILVGLTELATKIDPQRQRELGRLQHKAVQDLSLRRQELSPDQQRLLDESTAEAFIATGDLPEAAQVYEGMLNSAPKDRRLIHKLIAVYERRGQPGDLEQAKQWWVRLERLEKQGSVPWIEARLNTARLLLKLGETEQARKLTGVTRTLYPQLGTPELKRSFDELFRQIDRQ